MCAWSSRTAITAFTGALCIYILHTLLYGSCECAAKANGGHSIQV